MQRSLIFIMVVAIFGVTLGELTGKYVWSNHSIHRTARIEQKMDEVVNKLDQIQQHLDELEED